MKKNLASHYIACLLVAGATVAGTACGNDGGSDEQQCSLLDPNCDEGDGPSPSPSPSPTPTPPPGSGDEVAAARQTLRAFCYRFENCGVDVDACLSGVDEAVAMVTPQVDCYDEFSAAANCRAAWQCYEDGSTYGDSCDYQDAELDACMP